MLGGLRPLFESRFLRLAAALAWTAGLAGCESFHAENISPAKTAAAFDKRSLANRNLLAFLETNHVATAGNSWDLGTLTLVAFYYHPALAEARAQWAVAKAGLITAGERPNPSISVTPGYDSGIPGNPSPWLVTVTPNWPIETAGKRSKRMARAEHLAEVARWNLVGAMWQVRSGVRAALLNLEAARETESMLASGTLAQSNVVRILESQRSAGSISGYEVTQARVALDTARLSWQEALGQYRQARAQMAAALGVPLRAQEGVEFSFRGLDEFPPELTQSRAQEQALLNRSDVRGALADYAASQSALQLEIANQYPDLQLGPGYAWNAGSAGDNEWNLGLTLTLPILNQNQGPIAEAKARRAQAAAHFLAVQAGAISETSIAWTAYTEALRQSATAKFLLENLRRRLNAVQAQVQAGEADRLSVADAEVEYFTGTQNELRGRIKAREALSQLENALQSPLTLAPVSLPATQ